MKIRILAPAPARFFFGGTFCEIRPEWRESNPPAGYITVSWGSAWSARAISGKYSSVEELGEAYIKGFETVESGMDESLLSALLHCGIAEPVLEDVPSSPEPSRLSA